VSGESVIRWGVKVLRRGDESPGALIRGIKGERGWYDAVWVVVLNDVYEFSHYLICVQDRAWSYGYEC